MAVDALRDGKCVWWSADGNTASIYGASAVPEGQFVLLLSPTPETLASSPFPDVLFVNRPDTWDRKGHLARYIADHGLRQTDEFTGFRVYSASGGASSAD